MPVLNKYKDIIPKDAIYIGRGSIWGNPYPISKYHTRDQVCDLHKKYLWDQVQRGDITINQLAALDGKSLVCFCAPLRCHGDTLVQAAKWAKNKLPK